MKSKLMVFLVIFLLPSLIHGAGFELKVTDKSGGPVLDAVVTLKPTTPVTAPPKSEKAQITQKDKQFIPTVTVIQAGTPVEFPNQDDVQHHVYSFSKPKRFDLPLYKETTPKPVLFDTPGLVVLGCNIHDWMKAYVYVADTPFFAKSEADGMLKINTLPAGTYQLVFWHPRLRKIEGKALPTTITVDNAKGFSGTVQVNLKKEVAPSQNQNSETVGY